MAFKDWWIQLGEFALCVGLLGYRRREELLCVAEVRKSPGGMSRGMQDFTTLRLDFESLNQV